MTDCAGVEQPTSEWHTGRVGEAGTEKARDRSCHIFSVPANRIPRFPYSAHSAVGF